ncbi:MAG: hypothetical protein II319_05120 [Clostridia bacterium]|nr:hypothetical protein [Clostridia bacterium]
MMKIDWVRKLTSRKFWAAIAAFVAGLIAAFGGGEEVVVTVTGIIMSGAAMVAYIIGEGLTDAANAGSSTNTETTEKDGD